MRRLAIALLFLPLVLSADELRFDFERQSLTATYRHYKRIVDGLEVVDGDVIEKVGASAATAAPLTVAAASRGLALRVNGTLRRVRRTVIEEASFRPYAEYRDAATGEVLRRDALFWNAKARVFVTNPVAKLNDPTLADGNNAASAVPDAAYSLVDLPEDFAPSGLLAGPNVKIVDVDAPFTTAHADAAQPLLFERSQPQFEEVNAYFLIDRTKRYLQSLGYTGSRALVAYPIPVDPHAVNGTDNSFYVSGAVTGRGQLFFGDGGTDDAEDADIVLHEFMHSVQDWLAPGVFGGTPSSQSRALSEAIADYWAFSSTYAETVASGRDAACLGDWDARCAGDASSELCGYPAGADCLRRVDSSKTMANYSTADNSGTEHRNGEIWSSAMRDVFLALTGRYGLDTGKPLADTIVLESMFGTTPNPSFAYEARRLLESDRALTGGANAATICSAMTARGILGGGDCSVSPRGEVTLFQSAQHGLAIPDVSPDGVVSTLTIDDPRAIERLSVTVDIAHPVNGELQLILTAPDGTTAMLQEVSPSRSPATVVTFGRDAQPVQSLDLFRGRSARGVWKLTVRDLFAGNSGALVSWSLVVQFAGDQPLTARPLANATRRIIPVVAHLNGENGSLFRSDLVLFNRGSAPQTVSALLTPSGANGTTAFFAAKLQVLPQQVLTIRDIVASLFATSGSGSLDLQFDGDALLVWSSLYDATPHGRLAQTIESVAPATAIGRGESAYVTPVVRRSATFRTNAGVAEIAGGSGVVRITMQSLGFPVGQFREVGAIDVPIAPFSHAQVALVATSFPGTFTTARIEMVSGNARVVAYGSLIENRSGDPAYLPARSFPALPATLTVPVIGSASGIAGTVWMSDLWIDTEQTPIRVTDTRTYRSDGTATATPGFIYPTLAYPIGETTSPSPRGQLDVDAPAGVLAATRMMATAADGTRRGALILPQALSESIGEGESQDVAGVDSNLENRTNIGVSEITGNPVLVRVSVFDAAGTALGTTTLSVGPRQNTQLPLLQIVPAGVTAGHVRFAVLSGGGRVLAYASVVDNQSNDTTFLLAR
jgi:subtilisin-like proprotein convertase family protein